MNPNLRPTSRPTTRPSACRGPLSRTLLAALLAVSLSPVALAATEAAGLLASYRAAAGPGSGDATRGRQFFVTRHGAEWSCSSCHGERPVGDGRHAATGKRIAPLAPAAEATRFTDEAKVEKWFGRNCRDVVGRACTAAEKADVLAWLITVQP